MSMIARFAVSLCLAAVISGGGSASAQLITYRYDANAPFSPVGSVREYDAYLAVRDQRDATTRIREVNDYLSDYAYSEYRHLVIRLRFEARYEKEEWDDIIKDALLGLEAEDAFEAGKLGYIDEPESLPEWPAYVLDRANQQMVYYSAIVEAYAEMGDREGVLMYGDLALDATKRAWEIYTEQNDETAPQYAEAKARSDGNALTVLRSIYSIYARRDDTENILKYAKLILDFNSNDPQMLVSVTQIMSQNAPLEGEERVQYLEEAEDYGTRAAVAVSEWANTEAAAELDEEEKAGLVSDVYSNLGMIYFQTGDFDLAADAFSSAAEARPTDGLLFYRLGVAHQNTQNVDGALSAYAKAVFLGYLEGQSALETVYRFKFESTDGLEEYIESEGAALALP